MGTQIEDGELPEEGEIMEEEDEEINVPLAATIMSRSSEKTVVPSKRHFELIPDSGNRASAYKPPSAKFKDYDAKCALVDQSQEVMLSSWVSGIQRKNRPIGANSPSDNDRNDSNANTGNPLTDKIKSIADRDYRRLSTAEGEILDDDEEDEDAAARNFKINDVGAGKINGESEFYEEDTDFRLHDNSGFGDNFGNRRRRRSGSTEINLMKRQRGDFSGEIETGDENLPSSSSPPLSQHHFINNGGQFPSGYRGGFRGRCYVNNSGNRMPQRWGERTICKFFREGFCRDGDECAFSHNAADSHRRSELCKFYQHGFCKKGLSCLHLHGEYPCKAFHKGECSKEQCQYSHQPLNDFTQPIFDQIMKDEELASRISLPAHPLRRKVLIPQGPEAPSPDSDHLPPPSVIVPVLSSMPPAQAEEKVMAATGSYGFFNPITPTSTSTTLLPPSASSSVSSLSTGVRLKAAIPPPGLLPVIPPPISTPTSASTGVFSTPSQLNKTSPLISSTSNSVQSKMPTLGLFSTSAICSPTNSTKCSLITTAPSTLFTSPIFASPATQVSSTATFPGISSNFLSTTTSDLYSKQEEPESKFGGGFFDNFSASKASVKDEISDLDSGGGFNINLMLERITQQVTGPNTTDLMEDSPASPPHVFSNSLDLTATKLIPVIRAWKLIPVEIEFSLDTTVDLKLIGQISSGSYRNDPRLRKLAEKQFDLVTKTLEEQSAATAAIKSDSAESNLSAVSNNKIGSLDARLSDPRKLVDPRKKAAPATMTATGKQQSEFGQKSELSSDELFQSMIQQQLQMVNQMNAAVAASTSNTNIDDVDHRALPTSGLLSGAHPTTGGRGSRQLAPSLSAGNQQTNILRSFGADVDTNSCISDQGIDSFRDDSFQKLNNQRSGTSGGGGNFKSTYFNNNSNGNIARHDYFNNSGINNVNRYGNPHEDSTVRWDQHNNSVSPNGASVPGNFNQRFCGSANNGNRNYLKPRYDLNHSNEVAGSEKASSSSPPNVDLGLSNKSNNLQSFSSAETLITTAVQQPPSAPLSLREKRKNNEYESPLARATNKY